MRILLTNDDGFFAPGLQTLYRILTESTGHIVDVIAPESQRSATGHSITLFEPLFVTEHPLAGNGKGYAVRGTPADCVKLGIQGNLIERPDFLISGVNSGANLGTDVFYSGTVSAAMEGNLLSVPSLAVSLASFKADNFDPAARCAVQVMEKMVAMGDTGLINLNIPPIPEEEWQGMIVTRLGKSFYEQVFERREDPLGRTYYWQGGTALVDQENDTDWQAIAGGYVSITPMHSILTDFKRLKNWEKNYSE